MQIQEPKRQAIYCHLQKDTKNCLDQLARYHRTTLTNLVEEGAQMVVRSHLRQIQNQQDTSRRVSNLNLDTSW